MQAAKKKEEYFQLVQHSNFTSFFCVVVSLCVDNNIKN